MRSEQGRSGVPGCSSQDGEHAAYLVDQRFYFWQIGGSQPAYPLANQQLGV
ncbi:hypothetical protein GLE_0972 [Lysobacter enzymogenes]|uniref:Uncharacterized protein n=1 Tax=Lysobacter enzymogenes TaxID=69 RepID=A0A0S2DCV7_LYSEN|nr:hypothetical protein GLE_0972 [Lysobacter enzymogenes]